VLVPGRDLTLDLSSSAASDAITVINNGQVTAWIGAVMLVQCDVNQAPYRLSFKTDRASIRSGFTLFEGPPENTTDPRGPAEIIVQDRTSGLRFLPPLELSGLHVQRSSGSVPMEQISMNYAKVEFSRNLPDFLDFIEIQSSDSLEPGKWQSLERIPVRDNLPGTWTGELPVANRRFFRAVGIPTAN
jgi:hypothetical protein